MIQVLLADDYPLVRRGIRTLLEKDNDVIVIDEVENGVEALQYIQCFSLDVAVIDIDMPNMNGIEVLEHMQHCNVSTRVIILSPYDDDTLVRKAFAYGASGYVLKRCAFQELHTAVHAAQAQQTYISPNLSLSPSRIEQLKICDQISPREKDVLQQLCAGVSYTTIAQNLAVPIKTVEKHCSNLMLKLNVENIPDLLEKALQYKQPYVAFEG